MTNHNVIQDALYGEEAINEEHLHNNKSVRQVLGKRGIKPETLQPEVDIKKLERHVKSEGKKLAKVSGRLPENGATDQSTYPKIDEK
jgi:DNA-damage-inducible protein D